MRGQYVVRRPVPNAYLVRQRDRRRRRELGVVVLAVLPLAAALLSYVWIDSQLLDIGYEIHRLEKILTEEEQLERKLLMETSYLSGPERVEERARRELGLAPATLDQLIFAEEIR